MRILIPIKSRSILFEFLKNKYNCNSLSELSKELKISKNTLNGWRYNPNRYISENFIPLEILNNIEILDKQDSNWGRRVGGKKTYKILIKKYGIKEIRKRQSNGGKKSQRKDYNLPLEININNPLFLEFYGILLGDGWLSKLNYKGKINNLIGISGHAKLDWNFFLYCKRNIKKLFNREAYLKQRPKYNSIELNFSHKLLIEFLNKNLNFPIGKKINLKINKKIYDLGFDYTKYVIRGIFDTDGSFYLDKTPTGNPYPCISIEMKSPRLIKQLYNILIKEDFKVSIKKSKRNKEVYRITLKGNKQLSKWREEIGSSNSRHFNKINAFVAQLDRATAS